MKIVETKQFSEWFSGLRDGKAQIRVLDRITRLRAGNAGDAKRLAEAFLKCASITGLAIASISFAVASNWSFFWRVVKRKAKPVTLKGRKTSPMIFDNGERK